MLEVSELSNDSKKKTWRTKLRTFFRMVANTDTVQVYTRFRLRDTNTCYCTQNVFNLDSFKGLIIYTNEFSLIVFNSFTKAIGDHCVALRKKIYPDNEGLESCL